MRLLILCAFCVVAVASTGARAEAPPNAQEKAEVERLIGLRDSLKPLSGTVHISSANVTLSLGKDYYFLNPSDAKRVLVEGWRNPPETAEGTLGMVFPTGTTFLDDTWGAVITYDATFYVSDATPKKAEYDKLLDEMRAGQDETNEARKQGGFEAVNLVGWAQPPTYEPQHHDLIWARDIQFGNNSEHTLNYDVRHLGRSGVLSMNIVSTMSALPTIRQVAPLLAKTAEFDPGQRYADYKKGDKVAGYGLAGLVAAGVGLAVAKKAGLLAVALLFLKKFAVVGIAGLAGLGTWVRNLFRPRRQKQIDR